MTEDWEGRGRVFEDCVGDFWDYGVGAMSWNWSSGYPRFLVVKLPDDRDVRVLYASHTPGDWSKPGDVQGWNGNLAQPTFKPSILAGEWHGYITHGKLTSEPCDCCTVLTKQDDA